MAEDFNLKAYKENPEKFGDHTFDVRKDANKQAKSSAN